MPMEENINTGGGAYIDGNISAQNFTGRDHIETTIHTNNLQIQLTNEATTLPNYDFLIHEVEQFIESGDFETAYKIAEKFPSNIDLSGKAKFLQAVSLIRGRSFNALSVKERVAAEKCLVFAYKKLDDNLEILIFLSILEIDYYNYHGQESENEIDLELVINRLRLDELSKKDFKFLKLLKMSQDAKDILGFG